MKNCLQYLYYTEKISNCTATKMDNYTCARVQNLHNRNLLGKVCSIPIWMISLRH